MALDADIERNVEENGVNFVAKVFGQLDPVLTLLGSEVGGIHVIRRAACDQPGLQHGAQIRKDEVLKALLGRIVEEKCTDHVARKRSDAVPLEPGTLTGTRKPDRQNDNAF